jgi:hypothetical protein
MITIQEERRSFWLRLKLLLTLGKTKPSATIAKRATPKPRPHRCTTFLEMP